MQIVLATTLETRIKYMYMLISLYVYTVGIHYMIYKTISNWLIAARYQATEGN